MLVNYRKNFHWDGESQIRDIHFMRSLQTQVLTLSVSASIIHQVASFLEHNVPDLFPRILLGAAGKVTVSAPLTNRNGLIVALIKLKEKNYISADFVEHLTTFIYNYIDNCNPVSDYSPIDLGLENVVRENLILAARCHSRTATPLVSLVQLTSGQCDNTNPCTQVMPARYSYANFQQTLFAHAQQKPHDSEYVLVDKSEVTDQHHKSEKTNPCSVM